ncbi:MAG: hypothetical protein U0871_01125 [Gemmataceae bacterium]
MSFRFPQPTNEDDFELFCLRFLRHLWRCPALQPYGKRGERQSGIDLIDEGGGSPFRAAQCKHHEPHKTIPPAEITGEVGQALGFTPALDEYHILTTARRTTHSQNAVIAVNRNHASRGLFQVTLWTWDRIEAALSELDPATVDFIVHGDGGRSATALGRAVRGVLADHFDRDVYAAASAVDGELEAVKAALEAGKLEAAEDRMVRLEARAVAALHDRHRYELKAYRSHLHVRRGEWAKAGRELLDAKRFLPGTDRARANEALGLELVGERAAAHALARQLRAELAHSPKLVGVWVRTAPDDLPLAEAEAAAAPYLADDEELNLALAHRALVAGDPVAAERYARAAVALVPASPHGWFMLGQALHARGHGAVRRDRGPLLAEARSSYETAGTLARERSWADLAASARFHLGSVRWLLGDRQAEVDFAAATEADALDRSHRIEYAAFLLQGERYQDALDQLARVPGAPTGRAALLEAAARYERNNGDDRATARTALGRLVDDGPSECWKDAHTKLVQWAVTDNVWTVAAAALTTTRLRDHSPLLFHTLRAWAAVGQGDQPAAAESLAAASAAVAPDSDPDDLFLLAQAFVRAGDDARALPLLERCYRPGMSDAVCRPLLDCARRLDRHAVTVRVCRELRQTGETDKRLVETEIGLLQRYDPPAALEVAREYLAAHPGDRHATLWQSWLALRLDRSELVVRDLDRLPRVDEVTPQGSGLVLEVLRQTGQPAAGLAYAYAALREHFDSEFAHGQYIHSFLSWAKHLPELRVGGAVRPGTAVRYRDDQGGSERSVVIEEAADPDPALGEVGPDDHLARALAGRSVGEVAVLSDAGLQPRTAIVLEVAHKYVFRFRDGLDQFQVRFPGATGCQLLRLGSGDAFDPSVIVRGLEEKRQHIRAVEDGYRTGPMPLVMFARLAGRNEFDTWGHLTADPSLGVRCADGRAEELQAAAERVRACRTLVLDVTALITLATLDLLSVLSRGGRRFVVPRAVFEQVRGLLEETEQDDGDGRGDLSLTDTGHLALAPKAPGQRERFLGLLRAVCDAVRAHCAVTSCPQAADLEPARRADMTEVIGGPTLEALLLAAAPGTALWTDDLIIGVVARTDFGGSRVWTQAVLHTLVEERRVTPDEYHRLTARLVGLHYHGVQFGADTLVAAAEVAGWDTTAWPVPQVMRALGADGVDPIDRIVMAATAVHLVWKTDRPPHTRDGFLVALLTGMGSLRAARRLLRVVPRLFSLDVFSEARAVGLIQYWLRHPTGLVRP